MDNLKYVSKTVHVAIARIPPFIKRLLWKNDRSPAEDLRLFLYLACNGMEEAEILHVLLHYETEEGRLEESVYPDMRRRVAIMMNKFKKDEYFLEEPNNFYFDVKKKKKVEFSKMSYSKLNKNKENE